MINNIKHSFFWWATHFDFDSYKDIRKNEMWLSCNFSFRTYNSTHTKVFKISYALKCWQNTFNSIFYLKVLLYSKE